MKIQIVMENILVKENIAFKVMRYEDGKIISGADSRQSFSPKIGKVITMGGNGIYLSPSKEYVMDYYSGLADSEVLITFEYDQDDIITGNLNDKEPEISVNRAKIISIDELD